MCLSHDSTCSTVRTNKKTEGKNGENIIVQITIASDDTHSVYSRHFTFGRLFTKRKKVPFSKTDIAVVFSLHDVTMTSSSRSPQPRPQDFLHFPWEYGKTWPSRHQGFSVRKWENSENWEKAGLATMLICSGCVYNK